MTDPARERPSVVIAALTYRREQQIAALVPLLLEQAARLDPPAAVVVVDNDPQAGARSALAEHAGVTYVHEAEPGVASARNRALDAAAGADLLVFIDDDETPADGWLAAIVSAWQRWGSAAVWGPVVPSFDREPSTWVRSSGVFDRPTRPDGAVLSGAASNNLLLDLHQLRAHGARFDPRFNLTGGEDTRLIHGLIRHGAEVRWAAHAVVVEQVPADRSTKAWVLRRRLRTSSSWSRVALDLARSPVERLRTRAELTARGVLRILRGSLRLVPAAALRRVPAHARASIDVVNGVGMITGAWGHVRQEYARSEIERPDRAKNA